GHRQSPSTGFSLDSADVEVESDACINQSHCRGQPQNRSGCPSTEKGRDARRCEHRAEDHGRVHHATAVAPTIVLICHLESAEDARGGSEQRKRTLKATFPYTILQPFDFVGRMENLCCVNRHPT